MHNPSVGSLISTQFRFLAFRKVEIDLQQALPAWIIYVLLVSLLAGIGRYWDHPDAYLWQYAGLGSVAYVFVLSTFLFIIIKPLKPQRWSYPMVVVFVGLTSLPALLYAIPVERFLSLDQAQSANAWFLAVVALWRVSLYIHFLRTAAGLSKFDTFIGTLLPLSAIVVALALLNLEHVMFQFMAGIREDEKSANDAAYAIVWMLSVLAYLGLPITLICYIAAIYRRARA